MTCNAIVSCGSPCSELYSWFPAAYSPDDFIHSLGATFFGFWGQTEACPEGSFARTFEIKVREAHGLDRLKSLPWV